jgi:Fe-S-cluster containining protein
MKKDGHILDCCEKCGGKCCQPGGLYITKVEYKKLPKKFQKYFKKHFFGYNTQLGERCPFLKEEGCILGPGRFLECKLYPLEVIAIDKLKLKEECPYKSYFNNRKYIEQGTALLKKYVSTGNFNEEDVKSILNNPYPNKL